MIKGGCQCGQVRYEVDGELTDFCHCHCSICRKIHGAAFATWGEVDRENFRTISGEEGVRVYPFSERADSLFCGTCGSTFLVDFKTTVDKLYIALGTVDGDVEHPPAFHQFAGSKAPWFEITDDFPQHDGWPDED